jgi:hypothetical protein
MAVHQVKAFNNLTQFIDYEAFNNVKQYIYVTRFWKTLPARLALGLRSGLASGVFTYQALQIKIL